MCIRDRKGTGSKVTLGKNNKNNNAKYVGFGNGGADKANTVAGDSSAIIINGREASLDMSNIRELMVAGTAYINTQAIVNSSSVGTQNSNVGMGESISVKLSLIHISINQLLSDYSPCLVEALLMGCNRYWSH